MSDQPHSTKASELPRSPRVQRLTTDPDLDPDAEHEHEPIWSPSLRKWVCDICGVEVPDPDLTQPMSVPVTDGDGAPAPARPGAQTDPTPATHPDASAEDLPRDGDRAGAGRPPRDRNGRFLATPRIPPMSAGLAQALLDASAEVWKVDSTLRTNRVLAAAVGFVDGVRHSGGGAA